MGNLVKECVSVMRTKRLDDILQELCRYGKPRLSNTGSIGQQEWYCNMEMFAQGKGVEFKIASDFKHSTPTEAALICYERMVAALETLGVTA